MARTRPASIPAIVAVLVAATFTIPQARQPPKASAADGDLAWAAFVCSAYSDMAGQPAKETARLFSLGYDSGKRFFEATLRKQISEDEVRNSVPLILLWNAQGPTVDFRLGRIYAVSLNEAFIKVVKKDKNGLDLPVGEWRMDKELRKSIAESEYRNQNCALLK